MTVNLNIVEKCVSCLNIKESYDLARRMEQEKTNPVLGYRTAGSLAERKTGDMLLEEMKKAGLTQVEKDKIRVDAWEFKKAVMRCHDREGTCREIQLGAYQTDFKTNGFQRFDLVYLGKGTADEYKDIDVKGKLVLIEINQREEWWINYPVYQAHLKGAAALIAVQSRGYAQIDDTALNAQDIAGPSCAPAFSMSRADFLMIRQLMEEKNENGNRVPELSVEFDADTEVIKDQYTYNIVGKIPGTDSDSMILLSAHYDSYFEGFQDDNAAVAMIIGIARALLRGGYKPRHTIVVCALAAEEWGISDTKYDWSTGAYRQVFEARPEWQGHVIADLNFELPAHAHSTRDAVRCTYEYADFVRSFVDAVQMPEGIYPEGMTCMAGNCSFSVNWQGEMRPCVTIEEPSVPVFEMGFDAAWEKMSGGAKKFRLHTKCVKCRLRPVCKTCVANAWLETGEYDGLSEYLCRYAKEYARLLYEANAGLRRKDEDK